MYRFRYSISHAYMQETHQPTNQPAVAACKDTCDEFLRTMPQASHPCGAAAVEEGRFVVCNDFLLISSRTDSVAFFEKEEEVEEREGKRRHFEYAVCIQDQTTSDRACQKPTTLNTPPPLLLPCIPPLHFPITISQRQPLPNPLPLQLALESPILLRPFLQPFSCSAPIQ